MNEANEMTRVERRSNGRIIALVNGSYVVVGIARRFGSLDEARIFADSVVRTRCGYVSAAERLNGE